MIQLRLRPLFIAFAVLCLAGALPGNAQSGTPSFNYTVSIPDPSTHSYHVDLHTSGWDRDTVEFKLPVWMPGYYQIMDYAETVEDLSARDETGRLLTVESTVTGSWGIMGIRHSPVIISYDIKTERTFVANSYVDESHAYLVPGNSFLYVDGYLEEPVNVKVVLPESWSEVATGLKAAGGAQNEFLASDFDILYDSPVLMGNLEELPPFTVEGIGHRFIGYEVGDFDKVFFMENLQKVVESAVHIIGDIPYDRYTFIGIGPGRGGIEHLNNTTVSFNGNRLDNPAAMNSMMNFLAHEYFHHYNVKRIRPYELGPFRYDRENRTNLLWVSEGLTVYYEYLIVRRAGLVDAGTLLSFLEADINAVENDMGRMYQSLTQASYSTWEEGPFGNRGEVDRSISVYQKGAVVGFLLDMAIRRSTQNEKSLDDVMRLLYRQYYREEGRGFTDAEFQQACETVAGSSLSPIFEYVYTTKEIDYNAWLNPAGLQLEPGPDQEGQKAYVLSPLPRPDSLQSAIFTSWQQE